MTGLTLCPVEDVDAKTVDDICLPPAVWKVLMQLKELPRERIWN
jgi:hypothetical protein